MRRYKYSVWQVILSTRAVEIMIAGLICGLATAWLVVTTVPILGERVAAWAGVGIIAAFDIGGLWRLYHSEWNQV